MRQVGNTFIETVLDTATVTILITSMAGIMNAISSGNIDKSDLVSAVLDIATQIERDMDGTSGALYS